MKYKYFGYWNDILSEDEALLPEYGQILEELYDGTSFPAMDYLHGYCTFFAYQLARKHAFPIITVSDYHNNLLHAYCEYTDEDGQTWLLDIRGATTNEELFFDEFEISLKDDDWYIYNYYGLANLNKFYQHYIACDYQDGMDKKYFEEALTFVEAIFK